jgi:hypothetical protein
MHFAAIPPNIAVLDKIGETTKTVNVTQMFSVVIMTTGMMMLITTTGSVATQPQSAALVILGTTPSKQAIQTVVIRHYSVAQVTFGMETRMTPTTTHCVLSTHVRFVVLLTLGHKTNDASVIQVYTAVLGSILLLILIASLVTLQISAAPVTLGLKTCSAKNCVIPT